MNRLIPLGLICLTILVAGGCVQDYGYGKESFYQTYDDAVRAGAIKNGWVPEYLPKSASGIHEFHDLDTNKVWLRYKDDREESKNLALKDMRRLTAKEMEKFPSGPDTDVEWWFDIGIREAFINEDTKRAEGFFMGPCRVEGSRSYLIYDNEKKEAYYWCF